MPNPPVAPPSAPALPDKKKPEIVVIPDKYYGVALKLSGLTAAEMAPKPPPPPPPKPAPAPKPAPTVLVVKHHSSWPIVLAVLFVFLAIGGGFVYLNRSILFKAPAPVVVAPAPPAVVIAPSVPASLSAISSVNAVVLTWMNVSDATGYRVERKENDGAYLPLASAAAGMTNYIDVAVQAGKTYTYHVIAMNAGGESAPSNESVVVTPPPPLLVPALPPSGLDSDSDGLTDVEETLYGTDLHNPDTDGDGFLDGNEAFHLYNPAAKAPTRLLDSGLVREFSAPAGWSVYVPATWTTVLNTPDGSRATIDSARGETFVASIEDNTNQASLVDWYLAKYPGTDTATMRSIVTKGGLEGVLSADRLEASFLWGDKVFVLRYDTDGQSFVFFRTTYEMMLNSLKLPGVPTITLPGGEISGGPGSLLGVPTSTGTEAQGTAVTAGIASGTTSGAATSTETAAPAATTTAETLPTQEAATSSATSTP